MQRESQSTWKRAGFKIDRSRMVTAGAHNRSGDDVICNQCHRRFKDMAQFDGHLSFYDEDDKTARCPYF